MAIANGETKNEAKEDDLLIGNGFRYLRKRANRFCYRQYRPIGMQILQF